MGLDTFTESSVKGAAPLALSISKKLHFVSKLIFGEESSLALRYLENQAMVHVHCKNFEAAAPLFKYVLDIRRKSLGHNSLKTLHSQCNVASCYRRNGNAVKAKEVVKDTLNKIETIRCCMDPQVFIFHFELAKCYLALGQEAKAISIFEPHFTKMQSGFGDMTENKMFVLNLLAECHTALGNYSKAVGYLLPIHKYLEKKHGKKSLAALRFLNRIAISYLHLDNFERALEFQRECYSTYKESLGIESPTTINSYTNLACCYLQSGKANKALPMLIESFEKESELNGIDSLKTLDTRNKLAFCYKECGDYDMGLYHFKAVYNKYQTKLGSRDKLTLKSLNNLAGCYQSMNDIKKALKFFQQCYVMSKKIGENDLLTLYCLNNIANCHKAQGKFKLANSLANKCSNIAQKTMDESSPLALKLLRENAWRQYIDGNICQAKLNFEKLIPRYSNFEGENSLASLDSLIGLTFCFIQQGEFQNAFKTISLIMFKLENVNYWYIGLFVICRKCLQVLDHNSEYWNVTSANLPFFSLSLALQEELDLFEENKRGQHLSQFIQMHASWLSIAIKQTPEHVPSILAAVQGRDMAALMLSELEENESSFAEGTPQKEYLNVITKLRALKLELQLHQGGQDNVDGAGGSDNHGFIGRDAFLTISAEDEKAKRDYQKALYDEKTIVLKQLMKQKEQLEEAVAKVDADFALTRQHLTTTPEKLSEHCKNNEVVVLFFDAKEINIEAQAKEGKETNDLPSQLYVCVIHQGKVKQVAPLKLNTSTESITQYQAYHSKLYRGHQRGLRYVTQDDGSAIDIPDVGSKGIASSDTPSLLCEQLDTLDKQIKKHFWQPLQALLPEVTQWHVISHGSELHSLPLHNTVAENHSLNSYPGILFFYQRHHHDDVSPERSTKPTGIAVHHDDAARTKRPIPFVHAEISIINAITQSVSVTSADETQKLWQQETAKPFDNWHFSCHGQVSNQTPAQTLLVLDAKQNQTLGMSQLLGSQQLPRVVVLSACVVGQVHHMEGEPIGVNAGFQLRGSDYVIAPTQPVSDFYMPLFMALFYQAWLELGKPDEALIEAKRRLSSGQWYDNTEDLVREAYVPVITELLKEEVLNEKVLQGDPLKVAEGWFLSQDLQQRFSKLQGRDYKGLEKESYRKALGKEIVGHLIAQRANLPAHEVRHLCTWIKGFGQVRSNKSSC
ncbi:MAG: CHAT domain-containing protein/tetratricopeptide (TPR) repeat protein [Colwellia sp.]